MKDRFYGVRHLAVHCFCHPQRAASKAPVVGPQCLTETRYRPLRDVTIAGPPRCQVWCRLYATVYRRKRPGNTQDGGTILPIAKLMADSESGSPDSYSSFLVTICLSRLVLEIFACDRQTDGRTTRTITIAGSHIVVGQLIMPLRNILYDRHACGGLV